jgi:hypothetical protein
MPQQGDPIANAKAALAHANSSFSSNFSKVASPAPAPAKPAPAAPAAPARNLGNELADKKTMMDKAKSALPKMHKGGPVKADGAYNLKAGEHVLTEPEAALARKHALMASGMKSLAKPVSKVDMAHAKSTMETASKFKATKPAPSPNAPPDKKPGSVNPTAVSQLKSVSQQVRP